MRMHVVYDWYSTNWIRAYLRSHASPFVAESSMKFYDNPLFFRWKWALLEIWPQMVSPSQSTTFATPHQPAILLHGIPVPFTILLHILYQDCILHSCPWPLLQPRSAGLGTAFSRPSSSLALCSFLAFRDHPWPVYRAYHLNLEPFFLLLFFPILWSVSLALRKWKGFSA